MLHIPTKSELSVEAGAALNAPLHLGLRPKTLYKVECFDAKGNLKWTEEYHNLVVTAGLNKILDATFKTGLAVPAWYVGLKATGSVLAGDTMGAHGTWSEITVYDELTRPAFTPGSISGGSVDNAGAKAQFTMNAPTTVFGSFLADDNTKGGGSGTLYGGGDFSLSRSVLATDLIFVTVTLTAS